MEEYFKLINMVKVLKKKKIKCLNSLCSSKYKIMSRKRGLAFTVTEKASW